MGNEDRDADRGDHAAMTYMEISPDTIENGRIIEGSYAQDESLTAIMIPEGVTDIGEVAFYGCPKLREVVFPESLKYIREEAFGETALEQVILPEGLELIAEKAFYSCDSLKKIEVPGRNTVIEEDAFGCCDNLTEGFIAAGYPDSVRHHEELQYTLLWCSCPGRHLPETAEHAKRFITNNEELIMEWVIKTNNTAAMSSLARLDLLSGSINDYIIQANEAGRGEITALLMSVPDHNDEGEFDL